MDSVFTRIIRGELPAYFVWSDDHVVAFLSKSPYNTGHALVVPRLEVDHWIDLEPALLQRIMMVSHEVGKAIQRVFNPAKVGMLIGAWRSATYTCTCHLCIPFTTLTMIARS